MIRKMWAVVAVVAFCSMFAPASAGTIYVKQNAAGPVLDGKSWNTAFSTLQDAINASNSGDEIWVASGVYYGNFSLKQGTKLYGGFLGSETSRTQRNSKTNTTVLDGQAKGSVVTAAKGATSDDVIDGFTIRNGSTCGGAGVDCSLGSPTVSVNILDGCGYGIKTNNTSPIICGNVFKNMQIGINCTGGSPCIVSNLVIAASSTGISASNSTPYIINNTIAGSGSYQTAINLYLSSAVITNNILAFNQTGITANQSKPSLRNNCVFSNKFNYSGIVDPTGTNGNIKSDPMFANPVYDLHIQPGSPCRNTGYNGAITSTEWLDMDGQSRIQPINGAVDIGADESDGTIYSYVSKPTINPNGGTFTQPVSVTISVATEGATIRYTTDGTEPSETSTQYQPSTPITIEKKTQLRARAWKDGMLPNEPVSAQFTITGTLPAPTFSVDSGNYGSAQYVEIKCKEPGATIYYTTDGSDPTAQSLKYSSPIKVDGPMTLKAIATKYLWVSSSVASATYGMRAPVILYVDGKNTSSIFDGMSWQTAFTSVSEAIRQSIRGDQIWVKAGIYKDTVSMQADVSIYGGFNGSETSFSQRNIRSNETAFENSAVIFGDGCNLASTIDGFAIRNGGQAIRGNWGSSGTVSNCIISNNYAKEVDGLGFYCDTNGRFNLINDVFIGNCSKTHSGGAINIQQGYVEITNNTICGNSARDGAGVNVVWGSALIRNTIIAYNTSGVYASADGYVSIYNSCVYGNTMYDYYIRTGGNLHNPTGTNGNISAEPAFTDVDHGDLRLQPNSPCRNTGDSSIITAGMLDIDNQARIQESQVDMGAYESDGATRAAAPLIIHVSPQGDDLKDGSSWSSAKRTIQGALNYIVSKNAGGEIWAQAGTYNECVTFGLFTHLYGGFAGVETNRSQRDWKTNVTTIDAGHNGRAITVRGCSVFGTLDGFTVCNGSTSTNESGAGIECYNSSPTIINNTVAGNSSAEFAGGIFCADSYAKILNNRISHNSAVYGGGGISCKGSTNALISGNSIEDNSARAGGAIDCSNGSPSATITNNLMLKNSASYGGAVYASTAWGVFANNLILGNTSANGGGIYSDYAGLFVNNIIAYNSSGVNTTKTAPFTANCIYGNTDYDCSISGIIGSNSNFSADPLFVNRDAEDYRLLSTSPCVDSGVPDNSPSVDILGVPRPLDGNGDGVSRQDVGCYECSRGFQSLDKVKELADGSLVSLTGLAPTASLNDRFYVENGARVIGIGVIGRSAPMGKSLTIEGRMVTIDGERLVSAYNVIQGEQAAAPAPWFMNERSIGGGPLGLQCAVSDWHFIKKPGAKYSVRELFVSAGANNIGLLVKVAGRVSDCGNGFFYLDGGAGIDDGNPGVKGIRVDWPFNIPAPANGKVVSVIGISSCRVVQDAGAGDVVVRLLRPITADSVTVIK